VLDTEWMFIYVRKWNDAYPQLTSWQSIQRIQWQVWFSSKAQLKEVIKTKLIPMKNVLEIFFF
jgi:hypothetical protein